MQKLLGIKIGVSPDHRHTKIVATTSVPPKWNSAQALEVCDVATFYKLADVIALISDIAGRSTKLPPRVPLTEPPVAIVKQLFEKVFTWTDAIKAFKASVHHLVDPPHQAQPQIQEDLPASVRLFKALHTVDTNKKILKVQRNFLLVGAHVAYMKDFTKMSAHTPTDEDQNIPDLTFQHLDARIHGTLGKEERAYLEKLSKTHGSNALRFALQLALFLSPLVLLFFIALEKNTFDRNHLIRISLALGVDKPDSILQIEIKIWKALFAIVEDPSRIRQILATLANELPDPDTLPPEDVNWFQERLNASRPIQSPLISASPSMPPAATLSRPGLPQPTMPSITEPKDVAARLADQPAPLQMTLREDNDVPELQEVDDEDDEREEEDLLHEQEMNTTIPPSPLSLVAPSDGGGGDLQHRLSREQEKDAATPPSPPSSAPPGGSGDPPHRHSSEEEQPDEGDPMQVDVPPSPSSPGGASQEDGPDEILDPLGEVPPETPTLDPLGTVPPSAPSPSLAKGVDVDLLRRSNRPRKTAVLKDAPGPAAPKGNRPKPTGQSKKPAVPQKLKRPLLSGPVATQSFAVGHQLLPCRT